MRVLFIGDIVGEPGRHAVRELVPKIRERDALDCVVANGENIAAGSGLTPALTDDLFSYGVDCITTGDHVWKRKEIVERLNQDHRILRPANYPKGVPGVGSTAIALPSGVSVGVVNVIGRVFMQPVECPFRVAKEEVERLLGKTRVILVDIHAEATSEKIALGYYLDGMVSAVAGSHTHVQTADEKVLPGGTGFIADVGMCGPFDGVIGRKKEQIIAKFLTQMPMKFEMAEGDIQLHGAIFDIDEKTGKTRSVKRIQERL